MKKTLLVMLFVLIAPLALADIKGDLDGDGKVSVADVTQILRAAIGLVTLTDAQKAAADLNGDGAINMADATMALRAAVKLTPAPITSSPIVLDAPVLNVTLGFNFVDVVVAVNKPGGVQGVQISRETGVGLDKKEIGNITLDQGIGFLFDYGPFVTDQIVTYTGLAWGYGLPTPSSNSVTIKIPPWFNGGGGSPAPSPTPTPTPIPTPNPIPSPTPVPNPPPPITPTACSNPNWSDPNWLKQVPALLKAGCFDGIRGVTIQRQPLTDLIDQGDIVLGVGIDDADYFEILRLITGASGYIMLDPVRATLADVNNDSVIDAKDAKVIQHLAEYNASHLGPEPSILSRGLPFDVYQDIIRMTKLGLWAHYQVDSGGTQDLKSVLGPNALRSLSVSGTDVQVIYNSAAGGKPTSVTLSLPYKGSRIVYTENFAGVATLQTP